MSGAPVGSTRTSEGVDTLKGHSAGDEIEIPSEDAKDGLAAYVEKRKANFQAK